MSKGITQKQRKTGRGTNPASLANLRPFEKGQSGNPSGLPKGAPKVSVALMKLLATSADSDYKPTSKAERIAKALFDKAATGDVTAIRELSDRTEGKSPATLNVNRGDERALRYRQLAEELAAKYDKAVSEVVKDIISREPEAAPYFEGWVM